MQGPNGPFSCMETSMKVDTIYAPSTAVGGAIALIRVSGSLCPDIAREMLDRAYQYGCAVFRTDIHGTLTFRR